MISKETQKYLPLIQDVCSMHEVDSDLILAIVDVESGGNTYAARFEAYWKYFSNIQKNAATLKISFATEQNMQMCSWGLMQVMGSVAREHGYSLELQRLCEPKSGLQYGVRQISKFLKIYPIESDVIAAYNAGSPRKTKGGMYENQTYVDKVYQRLLELRKML